MYSAAATAGPSRVGQLTIAGHTFTVNQGQGCAYTLAPASANVPDAGGTTSFEVQTAGGCTWQAATQDAWITITSGTTGTGNGTVQLTIAANTGPSRTGTVTAGGRSFTVTQGQGCTIVLAPDRAAVPDAGGPASFEVQTPAGCPWTATTQSGWITFASASSSTGPATVQLTVAANTGAGRTGTVNVGTRAFTVEQGAGCTYTLTPTSENVPAAGANGTFNIAAPAGCAWNAASSAGWLTITSPQSGAGDGSVAFSAAANTGGARNATINVNGRLFTVNQASGCTATVSPDSISSPAAGSSARIEVTTAPDCTWTATKTADWITISSGASGTGPGFVEVSIAGNTGSARKDAIVVAGRSVPVTQESGCTVTISPTAMPMPAAGGPGSFNVTAGAGCTWTTTSQSGWIVITNSGPGSGDGVVQFSVDANATGAPRNGSISIAGLTFTVNQQ
jgi:hypothetical protein